MLFSTADDVHDSLGRLMQELANDPDVGLRLSRLDTVVQLRYRHPDTKVTIVAREGDAPAVHLGEAPDGTPNPDVVLTLDADVGHFLWLNRQNVPIAIARGAIQAKGDARKVIDLLALAHVIGPHYEHLLRATGREALIDPAAEEPVEGEGTDAELPDAAGGAQEEIAEGDAAAGGTADDTGDASPGETREASSDEAASADAPSPAGGAEAELAEGDAAADGS